MAILIRALLFFTLSWFAVAHSNSGPMMNFDKSYSKMLTEILDTKLAIPSSPADTTSPFVGEFVEDIKITLLSDNIAGDGLVGSEGFSAFVEIDLDGSHKKYVLFDSGYKGKTLPNLIKLIAEGKIPDFSQLPKRSIEVVLSHWHNDHIQGFQEIMEKYSQAFAGVHVGAHFFDERILNGNEDEAALGGHNLKENLKSWYNEIEAKSFDDDFVVHTNFSHIADRLPGVWVTGQVPRKSFERNYPPASVFQIIERDKRGRVISKVADTVPDDMALVINVKGKGLATITGCGHSGLLNILDHAHVHTSVKKVMAIVGGLHLRSSSREVMAATSKGLKDYKVDYLVSAHCTGMPRNFALQNELTGLDSMHAILGSSGLTLDTSKYGGKEPVVTSRNPSTMPFENHQH